MSKAAQKLLTLMLTELSSSTHLYRSTVENCYECVIYQFGFDEPEEGKAAIVDKALEALKVLMEPEQVIN